MLQAQTHLYYNASISQVSVTIIVMFNNCQKSVFCLVDCDLQ